MWDILYLTKDFVRERDIQEFINNRFKDKDKMVIDKRIFTTFGTLDGNMFYTDVDVTQIYESYMDYNISSITSDMVVLDIGANVGGFALRAARKAKHVYAVEPVMHDQLERNIRLNGVDNITVLKCGLGGRVQEIEWHGNRKKVEMCTLREIIQTCGVDIDYLKLDCEGAEYSLCKQDLYAIPRITAELHNFDGKSPFSIFTNLLKACGFIINFKMISKYTSLIYAERIEITTGEDLHTNIGWLDEK